ncbi:hypothetical protein GQ44DRAFT_559608, partial [Phaeosphaeriaceae sp. PMI808]
SAIVDVLSVIIQTGMVPWDARYDEATASMLARFYNFWNEWCRAVERNDKKIDAVVNEEGCEWLLRKDWRQVWKENERDLYYRLDDMD